MVDSFAEANGLAREDMWKQFDGADLLDAGLVLAEESTTPAIVYLLSDDASWVTGHTMVVDAGAMIKPNAGNVRAAQPSGLEQGVDELVGVEGDQVADRLAEADELDGDAELGLDGEHDAALGRAVELGQHDAGDVGGLAELAGPGSGRSDRWSRRSRAAPR